MLKLTKKADYGLMALKYLAEHPENPALSAGLSGCSAKYLSAIRP